MINFDIKLHYQALIVSYKDYKIQLNTKLKVLELLLKILLVI
jgi:hypothetical protein